MMPPNSSKYGINLKGASNVIGSRSGESDNYSLLKLCSSMEPTLDLIKYAATLPARTESLKVNTEHGSVWKSTAIAIFGCRVCLSEVFSSFI